MNDTANTALRDAIQTVIETAGIETDMGAAAMWQAIENVQLLDKKQKDYGSKNISEMGELGLLVRSNDKIARLKHLILSGKTVNNESLDDTWMDMANYAVIAQLVRRGVWE